MFKWWLILDALILSVFELVGVCAFHMLVVLGVTRGLPVS